MTSKGWIYFFSGVASIGGCTNSVESGIDESLGATDQEVYYSETGVWTHTSISVCWKQASLVDAQERWWVREAVEAAFEGHTAVDFTGWGACGSAGAHIAIDTSPGNWPSADTGRRSPSASANLFLNHFLGDPRDLGGPNGGADDFTGGCWSGETSSGNPVTGFTGRQWPTAHQYCIEVLAVHEFFHILGAEHEQNRGDTPGFCTEPDDGNGDTAYGYWDLTSVSNYCNPAWSGDGYPSQLDYAWLNAEYGWASNDRVWYGIGNVRDWGGAARDQLLFEQHVEDHTGTYVMVVGNYDGDDEDDVLMYRVGSGSDFVRFGRPDRGFDQVPIDVTLTYQPVAGDFNGDGEDDIFWYAPGSAADKLWFGNSDRTFDTVTPANITETYTKVVSGNFDGDDYDDVFFYAAGSTSERVMFGRHDGTFANATPSNVNLTYEPFTGDFDGDGEDDIFWYRPGTGTDYIWFGDRSRAFTSVEVEVSGFYTPTSGDFNGDGTSDVLWDDGFGESDPVWLFSPTTRGDKVSNSRTSSIIGNGSASRPYAGDFDGDGLSDVLWYSPG